MSYAKTINQNLESKYNHNFVVTFLGIPENASNILGRQIVSIDFPVLNFFVNEYRYKSDIQKHTSEVSLDEVTAIFADDVRGLTLDLLVKLLKDQGCHLSDGFEIRIDSLDYNGNVIDSVTLKEVYILSLTPSQLNYTAAEDSSITVSFGYYNIDFTDPDCMIVAKEDYFKDVPRNILMVNVSIGNETTVFGDVIVSSGGFG